MKQIIYPLATASIALGFSQQSIATPPSPAPLPNEKAVWAASQDKLAWEIVEGLTTQVGPRLAGTEAEMIARSWAVTKLKSMGFANVHVEPYTMQTWVRGEETAEVFNSYGKPQKMMVTALGHSGSTGPEGLEGQITYFKTLAELENWPAVGNEGRIAFVSHQMKAAQDGSGYGPFGQARRIGPNIAAKKGFAAIVIRSIGTDSHRMPHTGVTKFDDGVKPIPAAALSIPDAENLERMIGNTGPLTSRKISLKLTPKFIGETQSGNVIAEVPGSKPELPPIIIACHLDSWDLGAGAIDDGAGCAIITAAAKHLLETGGRQRTIRILWAGAEEVGGFGGKAYAKAHKAEPHGLAMESDFGADRVWRVDFKLPESANDLKQQIGNQLALMGIQSGRTEAGGGTDVEPIIEAQHLSVIDLQQDGMHYFDLHHTADDTLDKIDPAMLRQNVQAWTTVLGIVSDFGGSLMFDPKEKEKP
jgi:carboxypeptidase Q